MTDYESNKKYSKPIKDILRAMESGLESMSQNGSEFYESKFYFGFGKGSSVRCAQFYVCPESYEIMETALCDLLTYVNEEYPVGRIEREDDELYFFSDDGRKFIVAEAFAPGGKSTHDVGILMEEVPGEDGTEYKPLPEYVYGISSMTDDEILEWAQRVTKNNS